MPLDTSTKTNEREWFHAGQHWEEIKRYCKNYDGPRDLVLLSVFDASQVVRRQWERMGFKSESVDIATDAQHDMTSRAGFFLVLTLMLALMPYGMCILAPPCSLFVWLSSSMHKRSFANLQGDTRHFLVRLGNILARNTAVLVRAQLKFRSDTWTLTEQPKNSWMFKLPEWQAVWSGFYLRQCLTYQGLFGMPIEKGTHLLHNLPGDSHVARKMTFALKQKILRRNARLGIKSDQFYKKKNGSVSGTNKLSQTSVYPQKFVEALYQQWKECSVRELH